MTMTAPRSLSAVLAVALLVASVLLVSSVCARNPAVYINGQSVVNNYDEFYLVAPYNQAALIAFEQGFTTWFLNATQKHTLVIGASNKFTDDSWTVTIASLQNTTWSASVSGLNGGVFPMQCNSTLVAPICTYAVSTCSWGEWAMSLSITMC